MPTISAGQSALVTIPAGQAANFPAGPRGRATYIGQYIASIGPGNVAIGPFQADRTVDVFANDLLTYTLTTPGAVGRPAPITVSGVPTVGNKLYADIAPGWQNTGGNWQRNGVDISGATGLEYTLVPADVPGPVTYRSANIPFQPSAMRVVAGPTTPVVPTGPVIATPTAVAVAATYSPLAASQQWALDGADQSGATTYTQSLADSAKVLTVRTPAGTSSGVLPGMLNWKASNTAAWRAMRASGVGQIIVYGDSYPAGRGAGGTNAYVDAAANSIPGRLKTLLAAQGLTTYLASTGTANLASSLAQMAAQDPRYTFTAGSILTNTYLMPGKPGLIVGNGGKLRHTPGGTFNRVFILQAANAAIAGNFTVTTDTGFSQTYSSSATTTPEALDITVPDGSTWVEITRNAGQMTPIFILCKNSAAPGIEIYNGAVSGEQWANIAKAPNLDTFNSWNYRACLPVMLGRSTNNLLLIGGPGYNDDVNSRTVEQIKADIATVVADARQFNTTVVMLGYAGLQNFGSTFGPKQAEIIAWAISTLDIPVLDASLLTSYAADPSLWFDTLHLGLLGHPYPAASVARQLQIV